MPVPSPGDVHAHLCPAKHKHICVHALGALCSWAAAAPSIRRSCSACLHPELVCSRCWLAPWHWVSVQALRKAARPFQELVLVGAEQIAWHNKGSHSKRDPKRAPQGTCSVLLKLCPQAPTGPSLQPRPEVAPAVAPALAADPTCCRQAEAWCTPSPPARLLPAHRSPHHAGWVHPARSAPCLAPSLPAPPELLPRGLWQPPCPGWAVLCSCLDLHPLFLCLREAASKWSLGSRACPGLCQEPSCAPGAAVPGGTEVALGTSRWVPECST